jgi:hypothetical protein
MKKISIPSLVFFVVFCASCLIFILHFRIVGSGVWGDGQYYYAYLRSVVVDGDLNFRNELEHFSRDIEVTKTGMIANKYSIGPALLWLPFFLIGQMLSRSDGYASLDQITTGIGAIFYGIAGLILCYKICRKYYSQKISLIAVLALFLCSNLFFYTAVDPINSHAVSFFVASLFLFLWVSRDERKNYQFFLLGIIGGVLAVIRNQDIIFSLPVAIKLALNNSFKKKVSRVFIFLSGILIAFIPQIIVWYVLYGGLVNPYLAGGEKFYFLQPQILPVLFNFQNGLFLYSPILVLSIIGLYYLFPKSRFFALSGLVLFILQLYTVASWHYFTQGASYGGRMFISLMPYFILGFAALVEKYKLMFGKIVILVSIFAAVNIGSIIGFLLINP